MRRAAHEAQHIERHEGQVEAIIQNQKADAVTPRLVHLEAETPWGTSYSVAGEIANARQG